jgi:hypothetical protein
MPGRYAKHEMSSGSAANRGIHRSAVEPPTALVEVEWFRRVHDCAGRARPGTKCAPTLKRRCASEDAQYEPGIALLLK